MLKSSCDKNRNFHCILLHFCLFVHPDGCLIIRVWQKYANDRERLKKADWSRKQPTAINRGVLKNVKIYRWFIQSRVHHLFEKNSSRRINQVQMKEKSFPRRGAHGRIKKSQDLGKSMRPETLFFFLISFVSQVSHGRTRFDFERIFRIGLKLFCRSRIINPYRRYFISARFLQTSTYHTRRLKKILLINRRVADNVGRV